jgi:hypothetical protein
MYGGGKAKGRMQATDLNPLPLGCASVPFLFSEVYNIEVETIHEERVCTLYIYENYITANIRTDV